MTRRKFHFPTGLLVVALVGCGLNAQQTHDHGQGHAAEHAQMFEGIDRGVAVLIPTQNSKVAGTVTFQDAGEGRVKVTANVRGLTPNAKHAMHVHEFGDASSPDGAAAGGHYNPAGHPHGLPDAPAEQRHPGDLGNLQADASGNAKYEVTVDGLSIAGMQNPIIGRGVVVHEKPDDGGQPTGNAGGRIAVGVIGVAKSQ